MKWIMGAMVAGFLVSGCIVQKPAAPSASATAKPAAGAGGWAPTGHDDLDTVAVCLVDFMGQGRVTNLVDGKRNTIVVNHLTNPSGDFISDEQIQSELRRAAIPAGVIASLQVRNEAQSEVNWLPPGLPFFISDLDALPVDLAELAIAFPVVYPRAFAGVWLWMPGYSEDGLWAMVRFSFGPTPKGATATYILAKDETGKWHVINRAINYFM